MYGVAVKEVVYTSVWHSLQNVELSSQNVALRRNISCLFKTAKLELNRKDAAICSLEKRYTHTHTHTTFHPSSSLSFTHRICHMTQCVLVVVIFEAVFFL